MLQFKKYLKEARKDYTPEEISKMKERIEIQNEELINVEKEFINVERKRKEILKEKEKLERIYSNMIDE